LRAESIFEILNRKEDQIVPYFKNLIKGLIKGKIFTQTVLCYDASIIKVTGIQSLKVAFKRSLENFFVKKQPLKIIELMFRRFLISKAISKIQKVESNFITILYRF